MVTAGREKAGAMVLMALSMATANSPKISVVAQDMYAHIYTYIYTEVCIYI